MSNSVFEIKTKKVIVAGKEFEIKPFVLRTRTKFLKILFEIFGELAKKRKELNLDDVQLQNTAQLVPALIESAGDRLIDIYALVLNEEKAWMEENIQIKDEIAIIEAIMEVNDISFLVSQVRSVATQVKSYQ